MRGRTGLKKQLEDLRDRNAVRDDLVRYLGHRAVAASFRAFDIRRLVPVPEATLDRLFFVLQLSAIAWCGDRWADLRRWYREQGEALRAPMTRTG